MVAISSAYLEQRDAFVRAKPRDQTPCKPPTARCPDERKNESCATGRSARGLPQRLIDVRDDVARVLDANG